MKIAEIKNFKINNKTAQKSITNQNMNSIKNVNNTFGNGNLDALAQYGKNNQYLLKKHQQNVTFGEEYEPQLPQYKPQYKPHTTVYSEERLMALSEINNPNANDDVIQALIPFATTYVNKYNEEYPIYSDETIQILLGKPIEVIQALEPFAIGQKNDEIKSPYARHSNETLQTLSEKSPEVIDALKPFTDCYNHVVIALSELQPETIKKITEYVTSENKKMPDDINYIMLNILNLIKIHSKTNRDAQSEIDTIIALSRVANADDIFGNYKEVLKLVEKELNSENDVKLKIKLIGLGVEDKDIPLISGIVKDFHIKEERIKDVIKIVERVREYDRE